MAVAVVDCVMISVGTHQLLSECEDVVAVEETGISAGVEEAGVVTAGISDDVESGVGI